MTAMLGVVFARGGSKGLPGKHLRTVGGRSLIARAIEAGLHSRYLDRMIVSTDDPAIAAAAVAHGAQAPFTRPAALAADDTPELLAWQHAVRTIEEIEGVRPDVLVSVPATAPLRRPEDIDACVERLLATGADLAITVTASARSPWFNMVTIDEHGRARKVIDSDPPLTRRQDAPATYDIATVCYAVRTEYILSTDAIMAGDTVAVIVPPERAVDIDTDLDLVIAEAIDAWMHGRTDR